MSTATKTGPCRIPTFSSRIPQIASKPPTSPVTPPEQLTVSEISEKHVGKKVRVGEKQGVLKYVGNVDFAKGVWCGIELTNAVGKNDGIINGIRYFSCAKLRGLMAPRSKVTPIEDSCESLQDDNASGPYSILCFDQKFPDGTLTKQTNVNSCDSTAKSLNNLGKDNQNCRTNNYASDKKFNCTYDLANKTAERAFSRQRTYDILNNTKSTDDLRKTVLKEESLYRNCSLASISSNEDIRSDDDKFKNRTYDLQLNGSGSVENIHNNQSYVVSKKYINTTYDLKASKDLTLSAENLNHTRKKIQLREVHTNPSTPEESPNGTVIINNQPCLNRRNTYDVLKVHEDTYQCLTNSKKRTNDTFIHEDVAERSSAIRKTESPLSDTLSYLPINKSCENLINESTIEVKRRRTSKCHKPDNTVFKHVPLEKPNSLPQLRSLHHLNDSPNSSNNSLANLRPNHSTPVRTDFFEDLRKLRFSGINAPVDRDDDSNKRDSLECEESLGILTPDQMIDFTQTRSPSLEYSPLIINSKLVAEEKFVRANPEEDKNVIVPPHTLTVESSKSREHKEDIQSPNVNSTTDYSLGIIDADQMLSAFSILKSDTTMNLELPLDSLANNKEFTLIRGDQTPSPEELPLDTTPIVDSEQSKTESTTKSKTNNSFITSITSITSLDTGYQGDGEMSRPASRGADNSPLTRRPFPRPQPRRPDPMTDSDFYTESDADNHEDNQVKGDRKAQVIDGTLYGVDPQAAANIYVNNRENMDSSGVFTDIESGLRNDDDIDIDNVRIDDNNQTIDVSPSDSSKTISENSQDNLQDVLQKPVETIDVSLDKTIKENPKKRNAPSPVISTPSSLSSPRHISKEENVAKKYKMPKRDVASKVKAMMMEPTQSPPGEKKTIKKPVSRWDAVMDKISKNEQNKTNLKEIKSKVFESASPNKSSPRINEQRKTNMRPVVNQNNKSRRIRTRTAHNTTPLKNITGNNVQSSIHSSLSDLSASNVVPQKKTGSAKKREAIQVTQVLTPNKLTSRNQQTLNENKKNANSIASNPSHNDIKSKRAIFSPKDKKQTALPKESSKPTVKGGRTSPSVRPPAAQTPRAPVKKVNPVPRATEALAVLVQHLVFNVEAYQVPHLKRQVEKLRLEAEEIRLAYQQLEESSAGDKQKLTAVFEEERIRWRNDISELVEKHRNQIAQLTSQHAEGQQQLKLEKDAAQQYLTKKHEEQLATLRQELVKLQRSHEESLEILREENDAIREQIDEKQLELERVNHESLKLKQDYESREMKLKEEVEMIKVQRENYKVQIGKLECDFQARFKSLLEENRRLRDENDRLLSYGDDKDIGFQEVQSLRVVLEIKQKELAELRKNLGQANQKLEILVGAEEKASALQARCEDLQHQLRRKCEYEQTLIQENQRLNESYKEEINQKRRISQYNEELQWKLKQNKEVITKVMEQAEESVFNRSNIHSSSFNEKHNASKLNLERTLSFRESSASSNKSSVSLDGSSRGRKSKNSIDFDNDISPPSSPKVKGVVEKSDSVSYVLDLDESPEVVASRIVRRSFRNTTPPKNTPTKSPSNKRPRIRNPLSLSASSSSIISINKEECERPRSASARNGNCDDDVFIWSDLRRSPRGYEEEKLSDSFESQSSVKLDDNLELEEDHEVDIQLPALPNEMDKRNGVLTLPSPKRLAAEAAAASDSNSEDESTSSSQL